MILNTSTFVIGNGQLDFCDISGAHVPGVELRLSFGVVQGELRCMRSSNACPGSIEPPVNEQSNRDQKRCPDDFFVAG